MIHLLGFRSPVCFREREWRRRGPPRRPHFCCAGRAIASAPPYSVAAVTETRLRAVGGGGAVGRCSLRARARPKKSRFVAISALLRLLAMELDKLVANKIRIPERSREV